ncbi:hypothetical protein K469DRAFT_696153 [Zopfia rhizophila CBS 207.26]|uniref:Uncharacterized protein n=1 Tax=Zopfia rhizophila CBS 207.26 TaxID=1314779 RepID=A0A6A6DEY4_9PEZI|nr:hypothetical protein K469DRAFT_696153 [Zopfia rhizophila CBS 207.26]
MGKPESFSDSSESLLKCFQDEGVVAHWHHRGSKHPSATSSWPWIFAVLIIISNALVLTLQLLQFNTRDRKSQYIGASAPYSPANDIIRLERQKIWDDAFSPWHQPPSDDTDAAWNKLLIDVSRSERSNHPEEAELQNENLTNRVQIENGDYMGALGVWHQLHCLDALRRAVHFEYYSPSDDPDQRETDLVHYDHCIEIIRRSVMCHADTAVYVAEWIGDSREPVSKELKSNAERMCVNWESLHNWVRSRALLPYQFKLLPGLFEKKHA